MAGRNLKPGGFDSMDKMHSNTLKRHPKMDLSRNDLLQLLSCLEGELQARDVTIAALKADKAKQLLYQAKYGRFGLGDPFTAMQRDSDNMKDNTFDESAIKSMYDNQLNQLENLIATQRKAQMKMRDHIVAAEKRYQKVCNELDDEKHKHAQDTAQGDDVTYMLEKERERLKQEVEFEKSNTKKMEKDLKKTLASLEEERANSAKHKQVALMLIKERKKLVEKLLVEKHKATEVQKLYNDEKARSMNMAEGLVQESKKSLQMEATMEKQLSEFDLEREQLKNKLIREENKSRELQAQVDSLKSQIESLQKQLVTGKSPKDNFQSIEIKSSVSPQSKLTVDRGQSRTPGTGSPVSVQSNVFTTKTKFVNSPMDVSSGIEHEAGLSPRNSPSEVSVRKRDNTRYGSPQPASERVVHYIGGDPKLEARVAPIGASSEKPLNEPYATSQKHVSLGPGSTVIAAGGRITVQTSNANVVSGPTSPRKIINVGRGVPPPIPPNKPVLSTSPTPIQVSKPAPPSKVGVAVSKDSRVTVSGDSAKYPGSLHTTGKSVQIPVSVVHTTTTGSGSGSRTPKHEGSPSTLRKPTQFPSNPESPENPTAFSVSDSFDFLGPEIADLQQLLVSMVTGKQLV